MECVVIFEQIIYQSKAQHITTNFVAVHRRCQENTRACQCVACTGDAQRKQRATFCTFPNINKLSEVGMSRCKFFHHRHVGLVCRITVPIFHFVRVECHVNRLRTFGQRRFMHTICVLRQNRAQSHQLAFVGVCGDYSVADIVDAHCAGQSRNIASRRSWNFNYIILCVGKGGCEYCCYY